MSAPEDSRGDSKVGNFKWKNVSYILNKLLEVDVYAALSCGLADSLD